ncbi:uncharacterized protein LOC102305804 [Haplochromis burtoni]|uniref:uncharacterized protein LOC102305804 n=1 Tax=Haplochromis burtoni TaxID=8153 RepID=UPI001C2D79CB|nr:uncharacterized protein LOC102305804 [Haplochromis burtoni]
MKRRAENQTDDLENHVRSKKLRLCGLWDGAEDQQLHPNTSKAKPTQADSSFTASVLHTTGSILAKLCQCGHSTQTHVLLRLLVDVELLHLSNLVRYLRSDTEDPAAGSASHSAGGVETSGQARSISTKRLPLREWDAFQRTFPVTLNGEPPSKRRCVQAGFPHYRAHYKRWRELQLKQRVQHILVFLTPRSGTGCARRSNAPQRARVQTALDKETWSTNKPTVDAVLRAWVAPQPRIQDSPSLMSSISEQKWKGLALKDFGEEKGKGVIALMPFNKGDVVCDYHGTCITKAAGNQRRQSGSLFFYRDECHRADATASPCACHLHKDSYGRHMNHCQRNPNVKPQRFTMNFPAGPRESVLFIALRDIAVGEELLWDYGV